MKWRRFTTAPERAAAAPAVAAHLAELGLIAYPTETVYGFGCSLDARALERLARAKRRGPIRPFLVLAADAAQLQLLVWTAGARQLATAFWPGPLTLVLAAGDGVPAQVRGADGTVAIRVSPHPAVQAILAAHGAPITSTSANLPGEAAATSGTAAGEAARALDPDAPWLVLDGGTLPASQASTIVRCVDDDIRVVRAGAVPLAQLRAVVEEIDGGT
jgi:L-threonylcarbamoyladenylate synthase